MKNYFLDKYKEEYEKEYAITISTVLSGIKELEKLFSDHPELFLKEEAMDDLNKAMVILDIIRNDIVEQMAIATEPQD